MSTKCLICGDRRTRWTSDSKGLLFEESCPACVQVVARKSPIENPPDTLLAQRSPAAASTSTAASEVPSTAPVIPRSAQDDNVVGGRPVHIMLDIETLGTSAGAVIWAIGACAARCSHAHWDVVGEPFYAVISLEDAGNCGLLIDAHTLAWWLEQAPAAQKELLVALGGKNSERLWEALTDFAKWLEGARGQRSEVRGQGEEDGAGAAEFVIWGNGAGFDPVLLGAAFDAVKLPLPWDGRQVRCYRTLKNLFPEVVMDPSPRVKHHALLDAQAQMGHLMALLDHVAEMRRVDSRELMVDGRKPERIGQEAGTDGMGVGGGIPRVVAPGVASPGANSFDPAGVTLRAHGTPNGGDDVRGRADGE